MSGGENVWTSHCETQEGSALRGIWKDSQEQKGLADVSQHRFAIGKRSCSLGFDFHQPHTGSPEAKATQLDGGINSSLGASKTNCC